MKWMKHPLTASQTYLSALEDMFGLAGLGYYWKVMEYLKNSTGKVRLCDVLSWRDRGLRYSEKYFILTNTELGLFEVDRDDFLSSRAVAGADASADASADLCADTSAHTGLRAVPLSSTIDIEKEEEKEKRIKETLSTAELSPSLFLSEEERKFNAQMKATYPRVCQMKFPLTCTEMQRLLDRGFSPERIGATLRDMENFPKLTKRYVSANLTLRKWMERDSKSYV